MPPVGEVGSFHMERVSPTVAAEAAKDVNEVVMDFHGCGQGGPLAGCCWGAPGRC